MSWPEFGSSLLSFHQNAYLRLGVADAYEFISRILISFR